MSPTDVNTPTVLAVLAETSGARACLDAAQTASLALPKPEIIALHVRVDPYDDILPTEEMLSSEQRTRMRLEAAQEGRILHKVYVTWTGSLRSGVGTRWLDVEGSEAGLVTKIGSQSTLNVIVNPNTSGAGHTRKAFHACIFDTHRPLLLVSRSYRPQPLRRVLVGWRNTAPTRRALEAAVPWLRQANHIVVASVGKSKEIELEWAEDFLRARELRCQIRCIEAGQDMTVGMRLLLEARTMNADWLVTGAFRYGEVLEWIFGGVTEDLLRQTTLPIFMMH